MMRTYMFSMLVLSFVSLGSLATDKITYHVRPDGDDNGPGTEAQPFSTIKRARDALRAARTSAPLGQGAEVIMHAGRYVLSETLDLDKEDSGLPAAPITYKAAAGAKVLITGAHEIPASSFRPVDDADVKARFSPEVSEHVLCADLKPLGFLKTAEPRDNFRMPFDVPELFFNGTRMRLACWPNQGWASIVKIIDKGTQKNTGYVNDAADPNKERPKENLGGVFVYDGQRPARWKSEAGVWLHGFWCFDWYDDVIRVESINHEKQEIKLKVGHVYGLRQGNPSPRRWRAVNVLEELDTPGEYYVERETSRLYFWPPADLATSRVSIARLSDPLLLMRGTENVTFRDLVFEETQGDAVIVRGCSNVRFGSCVFSNIRKKAVYMDGGSGNVISGCDVHHTGTGGVHISGGNRKTLEPAGHVVEDTHIWDFSEHQLTYASGLHLGGVGNLARHNVIHGAPHQAVSISGNDHLFEYNVVSNVCMSSDDAAAFYKGRNPSCRGNVLRHNFWCRIGSPRGHGNAAVYFDDGDGGDTVYGNVFYRCGDPGKGSFGTVFSHGGHGNMAENNVFVECKRALGSSPWNDKRWKDFMAAPLWQTRLLQEVDITKPPYTERYAELAGFMNPQPGDVRENIARRNLFVKCDQISNGNWNTNEVGYVTVGDPGFVDYGRENFRLKPDSEVFEKIQGFQPIQFEKMGMRR